MRNKGGRKLKAGSQKKIQAVLSAFVILLLAFSCSGEKSEGAKTQERLTDTEIKYFTNGKKLYTQHCANCHMENGDGLGTLMPPLKNADYLLKDVPGMAKVIVEGIQGEITVNGVKYVQPMPGNKNLNPTEITEILTYISNSWGNDHGGVALEEVNAVLKK